MTSAIKKPIRKVERLEARVTREQKALFQQAAEIQGKTFTDFIVNALQDVAESVIKEHEIICLTSHEREIFVNSLLNPPKPNKKFIAAAKFYKATLKEE